MTSAQERRDNFRPHKPLNNIPLPSCSSSTSYFDFPPLGLCAHKYVLLPLIMFLPSRTSPAYTVDNNYFLLFGLLLLLLLLLELSGTRGGAPLHHVAVRKEEEKEEEEKQGGRWLPSRWWKRKTYGTALAAIKRERNRHNTLGSGKMEEGNSSTTARDSSSSVM